MTTNAHNLSYYKNFYCQLQDLKQNLALKNQTEGYFLPINHVINYISRCSTDYLLYPIVSKSFSFITNGTLCVSKFFSLSFSRWLDNKLHDPISSKTVLKIGEWTQTQAEKMARQEPVNFFLLRYIHICSIMFARYLYIFSKDTNTFLKIPQAIHSYMDWNTIEMPPEEAPTTTLARGWKWIKIATKAGVDLLLDVIYRILKIAEKALRFVPFADLAIEQVGRCLNHIRHYLHQKLIQRAHDVIDNNEKRIRRKIVGRVAQITTSKAIEFAVSSTLKGLFVYAIYRGSKWAILELTDNHELPDQMAQIASYAIKILGAALWIKSVTPSFKKLRDDYKEDFDPRASTLKELVYSLNHHNLSNVIRIIQSQL